MEIYYLCSPIIGLEMTALPKKYATGKGFFTHILTVPFFVFGMLLLFSPTSFDRFSIPFSRYSFHVTMILCIVLVVMIISRLLFMLFNRKRREIDWGRSVLLCLLEIVFSSGFTALYLWLMSSKEVAFFWFFGMTLVYLFVLMLIPYVIIDLYFLLLAKDQQLFEKDRDASKEKIRFVDERDNLKLVVATDAVLYVQSDENYVKVCYLEDSEIKFCSIRNTMKRVEDLCVRNGLVRCHRSYFINSSRVQALQKDKEFTYAVLDVPNASRVPVSKNYYDQLSALL